MSYHDKDQLRHFRAGIMRDAPLIFSCHSTALPSILTEMAPRIIRNSQANTLLIKDGLGIKAFLVLVAGVPAMIGGFALLGFMNQVLSDLNTWSEWKAALPLLFVYVISCALLFGFAGIILFSSDSTLIDGETRTLSQKKVRLFRTKVTETPASEISSLTVGWEDVSSEASEAQLYAGRVSARMKKGGTIDILQSSNWTNAKTLGKEISVLLKLECFVDESSYKNNRSA